MDRVKNPEGRPDWLLAKIVERAVKQSSDPRIKISYSVVKHDFETLLLKVIGPRTKRGRQVKDLIDKGRSVLREIQAP